MVNAQQKDDTLVLTIEATVIDASNAVAVRQALEESIDKPGGKVAVDLHEVTLIDSAGVGVLLAVSKYNKERIALTNATPYVHSVLKLLRLQKMFNMADL